MFDLQFGDYLFILTKYFFFLFALFQFTPIYLTQNLHFRDDFFFKKEHQFKKKNYLLKK